VFFVSLCSGCNFLYIASNRYLLPEVCPKCSLKVTLLDYTQFSQDFIDEIAELNKENQTYSMCFPSSALFFSTNTVGLLQLKQIIAEIKYPQELVFKIKDLK
jgi:hypothetical protein